MARSSLALAFAVVCLGGPAVGCGEEGDECESTADCRAGLVCVVEIHEDGSVTTTCQKSD